MTTRIWLLTAGVLSLGAPAAVRADALGADAMSGARGKKFSFALWGDLPYTAEETAKIPNLIADINADHDLLFSAFDGDIKGGSTVCSDDVYQAAIDRFNSIRIPTVYIPGDNEWTDCHRTNNGGFNALERLQHIRSTMFTTPFSFGRRKMPLEHQGPLGGLYVENTRWVAGDVVFVGLNVPGSNNNKIDEGACLSSKSVRTQADCDADNAEFAARDAANIQYLHETFAKAKARGSIGVMIIIQADPSFDLPETEDVNERTQPGVDGYDAFLAAIVAETQAFAGEVVLVHGDTHFFKVDKPLLDQGHLLPTFTRVETFGHPNVHWVKATVDPSSRSIFQFEPMVVPGN